MRYHFIKTIVGLLALGLLALVAIFSTQPAQAETRTVTSTLDSGPGTLRQAVFDANTGDTVIFAPAVFSAPMTITLATQIKITASLTIDGAAGDVSMPTISGGKATSIIAVDFDAAIVLNRLRILDGYCDRCYGAGIGNSGVLTVTNCQIIGNTGDLGGGVTNYLGIVTISNTVFIGNLSPYGGGILNIGSMEVSNSSFISNAGYPPETGIGGAIRNYQNASLTIRNSTFAGNRAYYGGAIANESRLNLVNTTIVANEARFGGGIFAFSDASTGVTNTILANNTSGRNCDFNEAYSPDVNVIRSHNLEDQNTCGFTDAHSLTNTDPLLGVLGYHGGQTLVFPLLAGSPALGVGDVVSCPTIDQRGFPRHVPVRCDMGATEAYLYWRFAPIMRR